MFLESERSSLNNNCASGMVYKQKSLNNFEFQVPPLEMGLPAPEGYHGINWIRHFYGSLPSTLNVFSKWYLG